VTKPYGGSDDTSVTGTNLFYTPIPFEFLKTYEEKPQVIVTVDNEPTPCHNMTCDFTYVPPVGKVLSATYDSITKRLIVIGVDLPTLLQVNATDLTGNYG
jgi:hypothetical protein